MDVGARPAFRVVVNGTPVVMVTMVPEAVGTVWPAHAHAVDRSDPGRLDRQLRADEVSQVDACRRWKR